MSPDYMNAMALNKAALAEGAMIEKIKAPSK